MIEIQSTADGLTFWVLVQPRGSKKAVMGHHQKALKIKLTAPPVDGAANQQCIEVLAKALDRPKSTLTIVGGHTSRRKQILVRAKSGPLSAAQKQDLINRLNHLAGGDSR
ncbi:MAG: DUF167 domain-containing protein [Desulfobacteraceae bacterium]|nr:MAG: DUF167 domain-containing protein [Desulfobacteraceae bacterium]